MGDKATITLPLDVRTTLHKICDIEDFSARYEALSNFIGHDPRLDVLVPVEVTKK